MIDRSRVTAVILSAGASSRMGSPKALLPLRTPWGVPEGEHAGARIGRLLSAAGVGRQVAVLGFGAEALRGTFAARADIAVNPAPERGMFSSVQVGLEVALGTTATPEAVLVWPVDVPLVSEETLEAVLCGGSSGPDTLWATLPSFGGVGGRTGHPVMISRGLARKIVTDPVAERLDRCLEERGVTRETIVVEDRWMLLDLDTPEVAERFVMEGVFFG